MGLRRACVAVLVLAAGLSASSPAAATDTVTHPFPGVTWLHRNVSGSLNLHALTVDLCAKGVSVRATAPSEKGKTVSAFGSLVGAKVAVNGDFFTFATYQPTGLAIGNGVTWPGTKNDGLESSIGFGSDRAAVFPPSAARAPGAWVTDLVSSRPLILSNGVVQRGFSTGVCAGAVTSQGDCAKDPRTGIGLSADERTLYLVVVDGRQPALSDGMTTYELASTMKALGASNAVNMDSGGSSQMWLSGKGIVNSPSDGSERVVANHLAVMAGGTTAPKNCTPLPVDAGPDAAAAPDASADDAGVDPEPDAGPPAEDGTGDGGAGADPGADAGGCSAAATATRADDAANALFVLGLGVVTWARRRRRLRPAARPRCYDRWTCTR